MWHYFGLTLPTPTVHPHYCECRKCDAALSVSGYKHSMLAQELTVIFCKQDKNKVANDLIDWYFRFVFNIDLIIDFIWKKKENALEWMNGGNCTEKVQDAFFFSGGVLRNAW